MKGLSVSKRCRAVEAPRTSSMQRPLWRTMAPRLTRTDRARLSVCVRGGVGLADERLGESLLSTVLHGLGGGHLACDSVQESVQMAELKAFIEKKAQKNSP